MPKITVYSTSTCPYCHLLKNYLNGHDMVFEDIVLDKQPDNIQAYLDMCGNNGVPCTHIVKDDGSETRILGFDKLKIDEALGVKDD